MDDDLVLVLVDTNVLLTATVPARPLHREALTVLNDWPNRAIGLCVSGQIVREYLVVATRPAEVNGLALAPEKALANVASMRGRLSLLDEGAAVAEQLNSLVREFDCRGKQIHDTNVVATALVHGVRRILTANVGDFQRFESYVEILDLAEAKAPVTGARNNEN